MNDIPQSKIDPYTKRSLDALWPTYFRAGEAGLSGSLQKCVTIKASRMGTIAKPLYTVNLSAALDFDELQDLQRNANSLGMHSIATRDYSSNTEAFHVGINKLIPEFIDYLAEHGIAPPTPEQATQLLSSIRIEWDMPMESGDSVRSTLLADLKALKASLTDKDYRPLKGQELFIEEIKDVQILLRRFGDKAAISAALKELLTHTERNLPNMEADIQFDSLVSTLRTITNQPNLGQKSDTPLPAATATSRKEASSKVERLFTILDAKNLNSDVQAIRSALALPAAEQELALMEAFSAIPTDAFGTRARRILVEAEADLGLEVQHSTTAHSRIFNASPASASYRG